MSSKTRRAQKRKQFEQDKQRRCLKRRRQQRRYHPFKHLTRNQQAVASKLIDGEVTMLSHAGWGGLDQQTASANLRP